MASRVEKYSCLGPPNREAEFCILRQARQHYLETPKHEHKNKKGERLLPYLFIGITR